MTVSTIPLAKGYNIDKLEYPVAVSVKHDGVPVRIDIAKIDGDIVWSARTRSGEPCPSVDHVVSRFINATVAQGATYALPVTYVAEVTHKTLVDFKDISGVVRRQTPQDDLILNFFDADYAAAPGTSFIRRNMMLEAIVLSAAEFCDDIHYVHQHYAGKHDLQEIISKLMTDDIEGLILRSSKAAFKPNTRHWDYQKYVVDPTVDLRIVGFEEAMSKDGEPKGMVGRINAEYKGTIIGIGPGKMDHAERKNLWAAWVLDADNLSRHVQPDSGVLRHSYATIQYKRDDSYTALRQPTFQHWRPEKTEPSYD